MKKKIEKCIKCNKMLDSYSNGRKKPCSCAFENRAGSGRDLENFHKGITYRKK